MGKTSPAVNTVLASVVANANRTETWRGGRQARNRTSIAWLVVMLFNPLDLLPAEILFLLESPFSILPTFLIVLPLPCSGSLSPHPGPSLPRIFCTRI